MQVISYNVNGIRAAMRKGLTDWLAKNEYDVICIQETKAQPEQIDEEEFKKLGYECYWYSAEKKGYSGVGIITRIKPDKVCTGCGIEPYDLEGRTIRADFGDVSVMSNYFPSGTSGDVRQGFKMEFLDEFFEYIHDLQKERKKLIVCGDYNICHRPIDIHDPVRNKNTSGFKPEERDWMEKYFNSGFIDTFRHFYPELAHQYSWWSLRANARANNKGWRIDYIATTDNLKDNLRDAAIFPDVVHSDHCPIWANIEV